MRRIFGPDFGSPAAQAVTEENYWSVRRQTPFVYLLGFVNLSALEIAVTGKLSIGLNLPTVVLIGGIIRLLQWYGGGKEPSHDTMVRRLRQTVWFAGAICALVSARCLYLLQTGDAESQMAVMLFGGLTGIGVAYGLTALPAAGLLPLLLIVAPMSVVGVLSDDRRFQGAAFGLVTVALVTMRLLSAHNRHFRTLIRSRSLIAREQELVEHARREAVIAATTDFLTGLPNRRALVAALDAAIAEAPGTFALAIVDLDRFKPVNDTFGHAVGDELLKEAAKRLADAVGDKGLVARLGGDEFGVLLPNVRSADEAYRLAAGVQRSLARPALLNGREFPISASCGIGLSRGASDQSPSRLMADADLALYEAKEGANERIAVFEQSMEGPRRRRAQIERALQLRAFPEQLAIVFQPIFDLKTGRIIANEALARWFDPELGHVSPSEFVPIAEQLNLIEQVDEHLMRMAFDAALRWPAKVKLSFNVSAIQLCSSGSGTAMLAALRRAGLPARRVQVEVTETALLADFESARANLTVLRKAGVTIVLDDFGAGYASIGYLSQLRFDQIKLDGGLVTAAQHSADGKRLLRAVVGLCEVLGVSTVAEHVESEELLALVTGLGCTAAQGFWLERPMRASELESRLKVVAMGNSLAQRAA